MSEIDLGDLVRPSVICFGEALVDRLGPIGGGSKFQDGTSEDCLGGAPANVACGLSRLGVPVAFCGRLGNDGIGNDFKRVFGDRGIDLRGLQEDSQRPSRVVLVRRDINSERFFEGFAGENPLGFADQAIELAQLKKIWPFLANEAKWLLIGTISLASIPSAESLLWCLTQAEEQGIKIALDVNWRPTFWNADSSPDSGPTPTTLELIKPVLNRVSFLKLSKEEALWFFNCHDPVEISQSLSTAPDVVITDGANPIHWFIAKMKGEINPLAPQKIIDTTGAGDAFTAGILQQFLFSSSLEYSFQEVLSMVRFAAACGAIVCSGAGAIAPQPTEVEVELFLN